jgi:hypothetical protein
LRLFARDRRKRIEELVEAVMAFLIIDPATSTMLGT